MAADPKIYNNDGLVELNLQEDTGWTLSKAKVGKVLGQTAMVLEAQNYTRYDDFEGGDFSKWTVNQNLVHQSAAGDYVDGTAASPSGSGMGDVDLIRGAFGASYPRIGCFLFKSPPNTGLDFNEFWFGVDFIQSLPIPSSRFIDFGWDKNDPTYVNNWIYKISGGASNNAGTFGGNSWHKLVIATHRASIAGFDRTQHLVVFDGAEAYYQKADNPPDADLNTNWRALIMDFAGGSCESLVLDEMIFSKTDPVYEEGTALSPAVIPTKVKSWDSHSVDEDTTGMWLGTTAYDVQYTTDGGSNYGTNSPAYNDGNFETLSDANLAAVAVGQDGKDGLRVRITHTPDATLPHLGSCYSCWIPRTNQVTISFTPLIVCSIPQSVSLESLALAPYTIDVGDSFSLRTRFITDGTGYACGQVLTLTYTINGGSAVSLDEWDPAVEGTWYETTLVTGGPGAYVITATLSWRDDLTGDADNTLAAVKTITVNVVAQAGPWSVV